MKDKTVAALLTFFLGGFGIHKFYLGETVAGVFYLLFCWAFIPSILAFFDFIGLLVTSQEAFDARYNASYIQGSRGYGLPQESSKDKAATLQELKKLYEEGIITAEEFEQKRRKILDSI